MRAALMGLLACFSCVSAESNDWTISTTDSMVTDPRMRFTAGQSHYLESCGGCHGIQGVSWKRDIPELRGAVGRFLCTAAGREYIVRLPNVAFANVDDRMLAEVMNFVVFGLGGTSAPAGAKQYSPREIAILRRKPLKNRQLADMRAVILAQVTAQCGLDKH